MKGGSEPDTEINLDEGVEKIINTYANSPNVAEQIKCGGSKLVNEIEVFLDKKLDLYKIKEITNNAKIELLLRNTSSDKTENRTSLVTNPPTYDLAPLAPNKKKRGVPRNINLEKKLSDVEFIMVTLNRENGTYGFELGERANNYTYKHGVKSIVGKPAQGSLEVGDNIIEVNCHDVSKKTHEETRKLILTEHNGNLSNIVDLKIHRPLNKNDAFESEPTPEPTPDQRATPSGSSPEAVVRKVARMRWDSNLDPSLINEYSPARS